MNLKKHPEMCDTPVILNLHDLTVIPNLQVDVKPPFAAEGRNLHAETHLA